MTQFFSRLNQREGSLALTFPPGEGVVFLKDRWLKTKGHNMKTFQSSLAAVLLISSAAFAHGEHKLGPHGGKIRMPGSFHTEVVSEGPKEVKVYLLDMKFQTLSTDKSFVSLKHVGNKKTEANCKKRIEYFH
jgi:hypothetical protein